MFDHDLGTLIHQESFERVDVALRAYEATEAHYRRQDRVEVVLIGWGPCATVDIRRRCSSNRRPNDMVTRDRMMV